MPAGRRVAAVALAAVVIVGVLELLFDTIVATREARFADLPFYLVFVALPANLGAVGLLLAFRRHENTIGWLLLGAGALTAATFAAGDYVRTNGAGAPFATAAGWVGSSLFIPAVGVLVVFLPLLYPTGRLPGRRWRIVAIAAVVGCAGGALAAATTPGPMVTAERSAEPDRPTSRPSPTGSRRSAPSATPPRPRSSCSPRQVSCSGSAGPWRRTAADSNSTVRRVGHGDRVRVVHGTHGSRSDTLWLVGIAALAFLPWRSARDRPVSPRTTSTASSRGPLVTRWSRPSSACSSARSCCCPRRSPRPSSARRPSVSPHPRSSSRRCSSRSDGRSRRGSTDGSNRARVDGDRLIAAFAANLRDQTDLPTIDRGAARCRSADRRARARRRVAASRKYRPTRESRGSGERALAGRRVAASAPGTSASARRRSPTLPSQAPTVTRAPPRVEPARGDVPMTDPMIRFPSSSSSMTTRRRAPRSSRPSTGATGTTTTSPPRASGRRGEGPSPGPPSRAPAGRD